MINVYDGERTALFIDGANLYAAVKGLDFDLDYRKMLDFFVRRSRLIRAYYYTAMPEGEEFSPLRPLVDWLDYNGYTMRTKPTKEFFDSEGRRRVKGNMDIEIAVDMLELAPHINHAILFSGDGDFTSLVGAVKRLGVRVSVVSALSGPNSMTADELRREADQFCDLKDLGQHFARNVGGSSDNA
ncbi:NYN domain-containing protein [Alphaproteobacteria bacterium]|nr:NYN domain-containing protein [Alphaproteobacteria bacterium]